MHILALDYIFSRNIFLYRRYLHALLEKFNIFVIEEAIIFVLNIHTQRVCVNYIFVAGIKFAPV